jgi:hypothetical protein
VSLRRVAARAVRVLVAVACVVALVGAGPGAAATPARPLDAPRVEGAARGPAPPPEYLVEDAGWVRFTYHPAARERVRSLAARADGLREELIAELGPGVLELSAPVEVRVAALPTEMARLLPPDVRAPLDAIALWERRLVVLSLASTLGGDAPDLEVALRHALAHLALDDALAGKPAPRWFAEGHAVRFAGEGALARARALAVAAARGKLVPLASLDGALPADPGLAAGSLEEAEAADFVRFLSSSRLRGVAARVRAGEAFDRALEAAFSADLVQIGRAWREDAVRRWALVPGMIAIGLSFGLGAALLAARRRRLASRSGGALRPPRARGEVIEVRLRTPRAARAGEDDDDRFQGPLPPDPGVPKVEHEGQWHTLH